MLKPYQVQQRNVLLQAQEGQRSVQPAKVVVRTVSGENILPPPANHEAWDWEFVYQETRKTLRRRLEFRRHGRPCPTTLTNTPVVRDALEQMKLPLKQRINEELATQAVSAIEQVAKSYAQTLARPPVSSTIRGTDTSGLPRTKSEEYLQQVLVVQRWLATDAREQESVEFQLSCKVHCGVCCPYPDQCRLDSGGQPLFTAAKLPGHCLLRQLSFEPEPKPPLWAKLLGSGTAETDVPFALTRIRRSWYSHPEHETCLACIRNQKCPYVRGRECLVRLIEERWMKGA